MEQETNIQEIIEKANQGDALSQYLLGFFYKRGTDDLNQSDEDSIKWFRLAADQNYAPAQATLGLFYEKGICVNQSEEEAAKWYILALEHGYELYELTPQWKKKQLELLGVETSEESTPQKEDYDISELEALYEEAVEKTTKWFRLYGERYKYLMDRSPDLQSSIENVAKSAADILQSAQRDIEKLRQYRGVQFADYKKINEIKLRQLIDDADSQLQELEDKNNDGSGCAVFLVFLLSPMLAAGMYGLCSFLSWIV